MNSLAQSPVAVVDLLDIVETLQKKGCAFRVLNINLDTATPTGKLMLTMLGAIATFEREMMLERQAEGIARAKEAGRYKGRKPTARSQAPAIRALAGQGLTRQAIAEKVGHGRRGENLYVREPDGSEHFETQEFIRRWERDGKPEERRFTRAVKVLADDLPWIADEYLRSDGEAAS